MVLVVGVGDSNDKIPTRVVNMGQRKYELWTSKMEQLMLDKRFFKLNKNRTENKSNRSMKICYRKCKKVLELDCIQKKIQ